MASPSSPASSAQTFRRLVHTAMSVALAAGTAMAADPVTPPARPPHLVVIFSDQQHAWALGRRDPTFVTPAQDAFAAESCDFLQTYVSCPLCSPSRATLLTGLLPDRSGVLKNGAPLQRATIAPALQAAGYRTAYFGKWHLRVQPVAVTGWSVQTGVMDEYAKGNHALSDDETRDAALAFIGTCDPRVPTAIFVSFDQPHDIYRVSPSSPYPAAEAATIPPADPSIPAPPGLDQADADLAVDWPEYLRPAAVKAAQKAFGSDPLAWQRYRTAYRQYTAGYDRNFARIVEALKRQKLWDDAIVVATSDHGDMDGHHHLAFKGPAPYQQLQRVPLAIRVPPARGGRIGLRPDLVTNADIPATLLDYAGAPTTGLDGISLRPVLEGKVATHPRDQVVVRFPEPVMHTLHVGPWSYTRCADGRQWLFNLEQDPDELRNLVPASPPELAGIAKRLDAWLEQRKQ